MAGNVPPYRRVKADYLAGASWGQLAARYKVEQRHLHTRMKRAAARAGDPWPLRPPDRRPLEAALESYDRCVVTGLQLELAEFVRWSGMDLKDVAREAGLCPTTIYKITGGHKQTVTCKTRDRIMAVIERHEAAVAS